MTFFEDFTCICFLVFFVLYLVALISGLLVMLVIPVFMLVSGKWIAGTFLAFSLWPILIALWGQK